MVTILRNRHGEQSWNPFFNKLFEHNRKSNNYFYPILIIYLLSWVILVAKSAGLLPWSKWVRIQFALFSSLSD